MNQRNVGGTTASPPGLIVAVRVAADRVDTLRELLEFARPGHTYVVFQDGGGRGLSPDEVVAPPGFEVEWAEPGVQLAPHRVYLVPPVGALEVEDGVFVVSGAAARHTGAVGARPASSGSSTRVDAGPADRVGYGTTAVLVADQPGPAASAGEPAGTSHVTFKEIAEATPAMMWSVSPDGTTWRNAGMRGFLGLTGREDPLWLGDASVRFIHPDDCERLEGAVRGVLATAQPWSGRYRLRRCDGTYRWVETTINSLRMDDGTIHSVGVVSDIDDRLAAEASLRQLNRELEERVEERTEELADRNERLRRRNEVLDQFAHAASHDLRAPLRTIRSYIELLEDELSVVDLNGRPALDITERISASAQRMQRLLGSLLRYSMVGRREFESVPVDPTHSARAAVEDLRADIVESEAVVEIGELPSIIGDRDGMTEIFNNVISNAIRYRGDEAPMVWITGELVGDVVRIEVRDNGRGFDPKFATVVFEPFRRLAAIDEGGTGLGLAICAGIVDRMGGKISAISSPGVGTTIVMELRSADT